MHVQFQSGAIGGSFDMHTAGLMLDSKVKPATLNGFNRLLYFIKTAAIFHDSDITHRCHIVYDKNQFIFTTPVLNIMADKLTKSRFI